MRLSPKDKEDLWRSRPDPQKSETAAKAVQTTSQNGTTDRGAIAPAKPGAAPWAYAGDDRAVGLGIILPLMSV